ncbi:hypothetical protein GGU11DRAFT_753352 [Lentinula aff. detonsa]|nr:hypothetical protein GGU11DRAFT_753352 [Lentinula aff. detonsa]
MLFSISISYVLLGLVALVYVYAIPVNTGVTYPNRQTAPEYPPHELLDRRQPKDKIYICFVDRGAHAGIGCSDPKIKKEINLILKEYRQHILNVKEPFELSFMNRYDGVIEDDGHSFEFWGEGVGEDCTTSERMCPVVYLHDDTFVEDEVVDKTDPNTLMACIYAMTDWKPLLELKVRMRYNGTSPDDVGVEYMWTMVNFTNCEKYNNEEKTLGSWN